MRIIAIFWLLLVGTTGNSILSFVAEDASNQYGISNGDTLTITFEHPITPSPSIESKTDIDLYFNFSTPIGSDYTGAWSSPTVAVITLVDVRNDSLPVITYAWDLIGTVYFNATSMEIDAEKIGEESLLRQELKVNDWIRIERQPSQGVPILYLNGSSMFRGGTRVIYGGDEITIMDPKFYAAPRPIVDDLPYANIERRRLVGTIPPPYQSPRYLTDIHRLAVGVNYLSDGSTWSLEPWTVGAFVNDTRTPLWERKSMLQTLTGTYGVPGITKGNPGIWMNDTIYNKAHNDTRMMLVNNTNDTYYTIALTGDEVNHGCVAYDNPLDPTPGLSTNDSLHLYFSNRTSAPTSPIVITINTASYNIHSSKIPTWYDASYTARANTTEVTVPKNMTINGIDMVTQLCRFHLLFQVGDIQMATSDSFSVIDTKETVRAKLEQLPMFGNNSIASVETFGNQQGSGWIISLGTDCPFCRAGKLDVFIVPTFFASEITFNGKKRTTRVCGVVCLFVAVRCWLLLLLLLLFGCQLLGCG
jgi:hypothetical protein